MKGDSSTSERPIPERKHTLTLMPKKEIKSDMHGTNIGGIPDMFLSICGDQTGLLLRENDCVTIGDQFISLQSKQEVWRCSPMLVDSKQNEVVIGIENAEQDVRVTPATSYAQLPRIIQLQHL